MKYFGKTVLLAAAAVLLSCPHIFARQENSEPPADSTAAAAPEFDQNAPMFSQDGAPRRYYIRHINVHGVQYLKATSSRTPSRVCGASASSRT